MSVIFFHTHTDTVKPGKGIEVIEEKGNLYSKNETILAADDKAGIAIVIEAVRYILENKIETGHVDFIFSPGEEIGLIGSSHLDLANISAPMGYVLDSAGEVGRVTVASPTVYTYNIMINGESAHAGLEPETGISAIDILREGLLGTQTGRIDEETTANIGIVSGGEATNVVMDELYLKGEVRSISNEKAQSLIFQVKKSFETSVKKFGGGVSIDVQKMATGFDIKENQPVMMLLKDALHAINLPMKVEKSGGGSDANVFNAKGKSTVNLSIGYEKIHTTEETVSIHEMEKAVGLVISLIKNAPKNF